MPIVNGQNARAAVIGAIGLLALIIACMTAIIVLSDDTIPQEFSMIATTLVGALAGFLAGTRVVPPDVSDEIKRQPLNAAEIEHIAHEEAKK